jgi:DNA repair protein RecO (recombination protein O)
MNRAFTCHGLVLRARPQGESNREVTFLTAEEGVVRATVFGGPKSRLRAHAAPYHEGMVWLYRDPAKDYYKVTDFDVRLWRPGLREGYGRSMAAAALAETLLASYGGGAAREEALSLASGTLDALENADEKTARLIMSAFFWNWLAILGSRPDTERCGVCGKQAGEGEVMRYARGAGEVFCAACAREEPFPGTAEYIPLHPGTRRWLAAASALPAPEITRRTPEASLEGAARAFVTAALAAALGRRLQTWDW